MRSCEQTSGWTVLQHGESVHQMLEHLISHLTSGEPIEGWRIPAWLTSHGKQIAESCHEPSVRHYYTVYHDCGKPHCRTVDENGKAHFPDHAKASQNAFTKAVDGSMSIAANLIGHDMILHTASADEIDSLCRSEWSKEDACTLLLSALAEVHSNAQLFGGIESTSFKQKWKTLDRRGKQIVRLYFEA